MKKTSHRGEKEELLFAKSKQRGYAQKHIVQLLFTLSFLTNLRRKWSGKLATFPSDVGAWKGEVFFSESDHSSKN